MTVVALLHEHSRAWGHGGRGAGRKASRASRTCFELHAGYCPYVNARPYFDSERETNKIHVLRGVGSGLGEEK